MLPILLVIPTKLIPQTKKAAGNFWRGGVEGLAELGSIAGRGHVCQQTIGGSRQEGSQGLEASSNMSRINSDSTSLRIRRINCRAMALQLRK